MVIKSNASKCNSIPQLFNNNNNNNSNVITNNEKEKETAKSNPF